MSRLTPIPGESIPDKRSQRAAAAQRRKAEHARLQAIGGAAIRDGFAAAFRPAPGTVVSGYWPMGDEADVRPLLAWLAEIGCATALPVVRERAQALEFRLWRPGEALEPGDHGTLHPAADAPAVTPSLVLVPLLAFDGRGHRLGYGGGYYDRTLEALRAAGPIIAVGVAYACQQIEAVPSDGHDQRLDWVATETGVMRLGEGRD